MCSLRKETQQTFETTCVVNRNKKIEDVRYYIYIYIYGGSNMTGTDLYVNKPHCAAAVRP